MKFKLKFTAAAIFALMITETALSAEWRKKNEIHDNYGGSLDIEATYYAAEYVERATQEQAQKNLWTEEETEDYRYNLLQQLKLDDTIPIFLKFSNRGPALRMAPFEEQVTLTIGKNRLKPIDFDRRFNFKIEGTREGFVYFPRYDAKGNPYLTDKVKTIRFDISSSITPIAQGRTAIYFLWDVKDDNPDKILRGKSGARIEMDRLTKRVGLLTDEGRKLQTRMDEIGEELKKINERMMELQRQM